MSDTAQATPSPRFAGLLCPPVALWLLWRENHSKRIGRSIFLLVVMLLQLAVGVFIMGKAGWVRLDWDGRGRPGALRWLQAAPRSADWIYSDLKPSEDDPAQWPGFRGSSRDGVYSGPTFRTDWNEKAPKPVWKTKVGGGHSSMTIANGRLFTIEQWKNGEAVTAYNLIDGKGLWRHLYPGRFNDSWGMGGIGPRTTPTWDEGRPFTLGGEGQLFCLEANTGQVVWQKNIYDAFGTRNLPFGTSASPLVAGGRLIITAGARAGTAKDTVFALDKQTGEILWRAAAENQAYMSPMTATMAGREQLLLGAGREFQGLSLEEGKILWTVKWTVSGGNNIAQPIVVDGTHVFISAGYGKGCGLIEVSQTAGEFSAKLIWENKRLKNKFTSSVLHEGHIYGLDSSGRDGTGGGDGANLVCLKAQTGDEVWRGENYGHGQLLLAQGHLIIQCENGDLALVKASPDSHQQIARLPSLPGKTWNNPALAGGRLYVRNGQKMICYDIRPGSVAGTATLRGSTYEALTVLATAFLLLNGLGSFGLGIATRQRTSSPAQ
jgi:outer membrane protein assembly factor BamB